MTQMGYRCQSPHTKYFKSNLSEMKLTTTTLIINVQFINTNFNKCSS